MNQNNPKLLFLAYAFPPSRAIGAVRCWNFAKHLCRTGWNLEVVTMNPTLLANGDGSIDHVKLCSEAEVSRRLTGHDWRHIMGGYVTPRWWEKGWVLQRACYRLAKALRIEPESGWTNAAWRACADFQPGDVDMILASGPPYGAFTLAARLSDHLKVPFVLDYRDLWTLSPHRQRMAPRHLSQREKRLLNVAHGVITVSRPMADCLQQQFGLNTLPQVITNGFDPEDYIRVKPVEFADFAVVYAGNFYPPKRTITPVMNAIRLANQGAAKTSKPIRLHYYGSETAYVNEAAKTAGVQPWTVVHGVVPRQEVLAALKGAGVASVITSIEAQADSQDSSILTGKLFEAFGARRPVLLIAPPNTEVVRVVQRSQAGRAFTGSQTTEMADWLRQLADGRIAAGSPQAQAYAWPQLVHEADAFLRSILVGGFKRLPYH